MGRIVLGKNFSKSLVTSIRKAVEINKSRILREIYETRGLYEILQKWRSGIELNSEEREFALNRLLDIAKAIPALAIFMLPFGTVVLFFMIRFLPIQVLPAAFYNDLTPGISYNTLLPVKADLKEK